MALELNGFIEHTLLKPDTTLDQVRQLCEEAATNKFAGVCIPPFFVREAKKVLGENSRVKVVTVVGFPMGYSAIAAKSEEIKRAVDEGADEIDAVVNLAALKSGNWNHVHHDVDSIARATHMRGRVMKLILECGLLTLDELRQLCAIASEASIAYVKTGTGFNGYPATPEMVETLKSITGNKLKIKAAGGIQTREAAESLIQVGADRIGTSAGLALIGKKVK